MDYDVDAADLAGVTIIGVAGTQADKVRATVMAYCYIMESITECGVHMVAYPPMSAVKEHLLDNGVKWGLFS